MAKKRSVKKMVVPAKKAPPKKAPKKAAPKPSKGRSLTKAQKIAITKKVCLMYATDKHTLEICLKKNGVKSFSTWYKWQSEIEEIEKLYKLSQIEKQAHYDINLVERSKTSLEEWIDGFEYEEITIVEEADENGVLSEVKKTTKKKTKRSLNAAIYALNNKDKNNFQRNPTPEKGDDSGGLPFTGFRFVTPPKPKK